MLQTVVGLQRDVLTFILFAFRSDNLLVFDSEWKMGKSDG